MLSHPELSNKIQYTFTIIKYTYKLFLNNFIYKKIIKKDYKKKVI